MPLGRTALAAMLVVLLLSPADGAFARKAAKPKKPKKAASSGSGGFGKPAAKTAGPTAAQLLKSSMDMFEELEVMRNRQNAAEAAEEYGENSDAEDAAESTADSGAAEDRTSVVKYVITTRTDASAEFSDWVPVALLALACSDGAAPASLAPSALGACVKEVLEGAGQAQPALRKVARETVEYAFEPLDEFESHVYEGLQGRSERRGDAATTLGVEPGASAGEVKKAHRRLMMELHPDRFVGDDEGAKAAEQRMLDVQEAYAELGGGQGVGSGSFYASIGGKARVSFEVCSKEALSPLGKPRPAQTLPYEEGGWRAGVTPMATSITREFVTRNLLRASNKDE